MKRFTHLLSATILLAASLAVSVVAEARVGGLRIGPPNVNAAGPRTDAVHIPIEGSIRNLSYELDFGAGAPWNEQFKDWNSLSPEAKTKISKDILPSIIDFAKQVAGVHEFARIEGLGGWHEATQPSFKSRLIASSEVAGDVADIIGYLAQQTKIFGYRWDPSGDKIGVAIYGKGLGDEAAVGRLWQMLLEKHPDFAHGFSPSRMPDGTPGIEIILDKGSERMVRRVHKELIPALQHIAEVLGLGDMRVTGFKATEESRANDWTKKAQGEDYLGRLRERYGPTLSERLELFRREELEPAIGRAIAEARRPQVEAAEAGKQS